MFMHVSYGRQLSVCTQHLQFVLRRLFFTFAISENDIIKVTYVLYLQTKRRVLIFNLKVKTELRVLLWRQLIVDLAFDLNSKMNFKKSEKCKPPKLCHGP
jgi:hypothetical protein